MLKPTVIILIQLSICGTLRYETIPIKNTSNFYPEIIPNCYLHCSYEEIDFFFYIENFMTIKTELIIALDTLETECQKYELGLPCETRINKFFWFNNEISNKIYIIHSLKSLNQNSERKKRNTVNNNKHTIKLSQLMSIDSQYNIIKLKDIIETLLIRINALNNNKIYSPEDKLNNLEPLFNQMNDILSKQLEFYDKTIKIYQLKDINVLLSMIKLDRLYAELSRIEMLSNKSSCSFPKIFDSMDLTNLFSISNIKTEFTDNIIIIQVSIPTIYNQLTKLYQIHSIPLESMNNSYLVAPTTQFYVTTNDIKNNITLIYALSAQDISICSNNTFGLICNTQNKTPNIHNFKTIDKNFLSKYEICYNKTLNELNTKQKTCNTHKIVQNSR